MAILSAQILAIAAHAGSDASSFGQQPHNDAEFEWKFPFSILQDIVSFGPESTQSHTMKTISAVFEVVTPMFLGGADQSPDGIRPASIKGALRFWWRALAWAGMRAKCEDDNTALRALHQEEARLFGLAAQDNVGGQGVFTLHIRDKNCKVAAQPFDNGFDAGILYLLGQGLGSFQGGNHCIRSAIQANSTFEIKLIFRPKVTSQDQDGIVTALKLFGLVGSLGSRARHGLGSVAIQTIETNGVVSWSAPLTTVEYEEQVHSLMPTSPTDSTPPLSALSKQTRIDFSLIHSHATKLLSQVGREQQAYRSYGRNGTVNGMPSEFNFSDDHDLALQVSQGDRVTKAPERIVFGLPHNYFFSSTKGKADVNYKPEEGEGRRASPLFFHVHKVGDTCIGVHVLLTAQFLPQNHGQPARIELKSNRSKFLVPLAEGDVKWSKLHDYLNRFQIAPKTGKTIYGKQ